MTTTLTAPAGLDGTAADTLLRTALQAPGGATALGLARLLGRSEAWVYRHVDHGAELGTVERIGPDRVVRAGRYRSTSPATTVPALLAGAAVALHERGWIQRDYTDDDHRVDLLGALRLAAGVHPRDLPDDHTALVALYDAEDAIAAHVDGRHDPYRDDAGDRLARWQDAPGRTLADVLELLTDALGPVALTASGGGRG